jgi:hypothetical protein
MASSLSDPISGRGSLIRLPFGSRHGRCVIRRPSLSRVLFLSSSCAPHRVVAVQAQPRCQRGGRMICRDRPRQPRFPPTPQPPWRLRTTAVQRRRLARYCVSSFVCLSSAGVFRAWPVRWPLRLLFGRRVAPAAQARLLLLRPGYDNNPGNPKKENKTPKATKNAKERAQRTGEEAKRRGEIFRRSPGPPRSGDGPLTQSAPHHPPIFPHRPGVREACLQLTGKRLAS